MTDEIDTDAVLAAMDADRTYGRRRLDELFRKHTTARFPFEIRDQLKRLVAEDELEIVAIGRFKRVTEVAEDGD